MAEASDAYIIRKQRGLTPANRNLASWRNEFFLIFGTLYPLGRGVCSCYTVDRPHLNDQARRTFPGLIDLQALANGSGPVLQHRLH